MEIPEEQLDFVQVMQGIQNQKIAKEGLQQIMKVENGICVGFESKQSERTKQIIQRRMHIPGEQILSAR